MSTIRLGFNGGHEVSLADLQKEVGPGWAGIIERLVADLFVLGWNGEVLQAKEKFGGLRFYITTLPTWSAPPNENALKTRINEAADESYKTCEECGVPGLPRRGGWVKTLCDEHAKGREVHQDI